MPLSLGTLSAHEPNEEDGDEDEDIGEELAIENDDAYFTGDLEMEQLYWPRK